MSDFITVAELRMEAERLCDENERLKAENEELRKELAVNEPLFETLNAANDGLLAENAELRELVERLYGSYHIEYPDAAEREFAGELRELGVEV